MSRLFTSGFEENDVLTKTQWLSWLGGTIISTGTPHSGTYQLQLVGNTIGPRGLLTPATSNTLYSRLYWKATTLPTSGTTTQIFTWRDSGGAAVFQIVHIRASGLLRINNSKASTTYDGTYVVSTGVYYRIEIEHVPSATVGTITCRLYIGDSTTITDTITSNAENTGTNINTFTMASNLGENTGYTFLYDDVAVNDNAGTFQNSWVGPGKTALLTPNSDTTVTWTKAGSAPAATNFGGVAEVPGTPDDDVTYNEDSGSTNVDKLGLSDLPAEVTSDAVINVVHVCARVEAGAASQTMILRLWDDLGATQDTGSISLTNGTWTVTTSAQHLVYNALGNLKTTANINSFSVGYKGNTGASAKRVTALWVNVDWIESGVTPPTLMGAMLT